MNTGTLYGIGVGPGDPELLTVQAVRTLERVDVVYAAHSTRNDYSVALDIARPFLKKDAAAELLGFPMTRDQKALNGAWEDNARKVAGTLKKGLDAAFLTLGDPLIYSTFGYLMGALRRNEPDLPIRIIPGITSFQAAAARTGTILAESGENLLITSGVGEDTRFKEILPLADNAVILKTYKEFQAIRQTLGELGLDRSAVLVSHVGQDGERIIRDLSQVNGERPPYLSLLIVKRPKTEPNRD